MEKQKPTLFVIDGYGQIYRSYYAFLSNPLLDKDGNNISAVFGFFNTLISLIRQYKPDYLAVALDSKGKTFRHDLFPLYKANRDKTPQDLHDQIPVITDILEKAGIKHFAITGMEADDIIATLAENFSKKNVHTVMVTGDKDLLQLVNESTSALRPPRKGEHEWGYCTEEGVKNLFGVLPSQIVDYLTILGDSSDNVPGIAGIGEKGAVNLLTEWGSLDNAYSNIESIKGSLKTKLENGKEGIQLSKTLIQLKSDLFNVSDDDMESYSVSSISWDNAVTAFAQLGSERLISAASRMLKPGTDIKALKEKAIVKPKVQAAAPDQEQSLNLPSDCAVGYDIQDSVEGKRIFDTMIAAWMLDSNAGHYELEGLFNKYNVTSVEELADVLYSKLVSRGLDKLFFDMEMPLLLILRRMEKEGIMIDKKVLSDYAEELKQKCDSAEKEVYAHVGHPFNLNSPKQLQEILFVERDLPTGKKTHSGFSTDSEVLEELANTTKDPVPALILQYRALSKLLNTYVLTLPLLADSQNRIHTSFLQTGTSTGRLSSKNPNLQNIPIRTEEGRRIRSAFTTEEGKVLLSADYAQIELAVLAHLSEDPELCKAFSEGSDVHRETAALIFNQFPDFVTADQRRIAKTINFGVIYGMSAFRLARDLGISRTDAQNFIKTYFERYKGVTGFIDSTIVKAREQGFVTTMGGHVRKITEINSSNKVVRQAAERMAVNSVIQGTAAEIVKLAMISIDSQLSKQNLKSKLILQVHDEVILEVPHDELEKVSALVKDCMINAIKLRIPLRVSVENGKTWGEMH